MNCKKVLFWWTTAQAGNYSQWPALLCPRHLGSAVGGSSAVLLRAVPTVAHPAVPAQRPVCATYGEYCGTVSREVGSEQCHYVCECSPWLCLPPSGGLPVARAVPFAADNSSSYYGRLGRAVQWFIQYFASALPGLPAPLT